MPEVRRIAKHRHVPKIIKKAAEAERVQKDKERRKVNQYLMFRRNSAASFCPRIPFSMWRHILFSFVSPFAPPTIGTLALLIYFS